jgi:hypothetical protein
MLQLAQISLRPEGWIGLMFRALIGNLKSMFCRNCGAKLRNFLGKVCIVCEKG